MDLVSIANATIPAADGKKDFKKNGQTADIIAEVLAAFKDSRGQLTQFAPHLKAATLSQTLENVWRFWKFNIRYQVDPANQQWIQTPAALWQSKVGDCKSLSLAVMCTLDALGIKAAFRFTTYKKENTAPTHVYSIVSQGGKIIPVDCVWTEYGTEKKFSKNWDYNMTAIYRLSGFDTPTPRRAHRHLHIKAAGKRRGGKMPVRGKLVIPEDNPRITPQVVDMLLKKQRLELEQKIHVSSTIGAIGDTYDRAYEMQIAGIHNALAADMGWPRVTVAGFENPVHPDQRNDHAISGVACLPLQREAETVAAIEGFFGKVFKGIGKGLKKAGKVVAKPFKAAGKLVGKGLKAVKNVAVKALTGGARTAIMDQLPAAAPFFLYTYITDPKILAKLPEPVKIKRDKALTYKKLFLGKLQIKESNFTGTVRNGIMQAYSQSPENVIASWIRDSNYKIGIATEIAQVGAKVLGGLAKLLLGNTGQNFEADAANYTPAIEDWGGVTPSLANDITSQPTNLQPQTSGQLYNAMERAGAYNYGAVAAQYGGGNTSQADTGFTPPEGSEDNGDGTFKYKGKTYPYPEGGEANDLTAFPKTGKSLKDSKDLPVVEVSNEGSSNTPLLIGGLALGALLLMSRKK